MAFATREKGRDLTQSYDKSPYTHRKIIKKDSVKFKLNPGFRDNCRLQKEQPDIFIVNLINTLSRFSSQLHTQINLKSSCEHHSIIFKRVCVRNGQGGKLERALILYVKIVIPKAKKKIWMKNINQEIVLKHGNKLVFINIPTLRGFFCSSHEPCSHFRYRLFERSC